MSSQRGPEFAHDLTAAERRNLERVLAAVPRTRPEHAPARTHRLIPLAAALAAVLVLFAVAAIRLLTSDRAAPPVADRSVHSGFTELAERAATVPDPPVTSGSLVRKTLEMRVTVEPGRCSLDAYAATVTVRDNAPPQSTPGSLDVRRTAPPPGLRAQSGCPDGATLSGGESTGDIFDGRTADVPAKWESLGLPDYTSLRGVADPSQAQDSRDVGTLPTDAGKLASALRTVCAPQAESSRSACWWTRLVELLTSPESDTAHRVAGLRAAAAAATVSPDPGTSRDVTGRPGISFRVPYTYTPGGPGRTAANATATADLTFDAGTGALLQRIIRPAGGAGPTTFTVYLSIAHG